MDKKVTGIVAYITLIGWLIAYLAGDKEGAKFHLNQALVLCVAQIILGILAKIPFIGWIAGIVSLVVFVFQVCGIIWAAQGQDKEVPVVGKIQILK